MQKTGVLTYMSFQNEKNHMGLRNTIIKEILVYTEKSYLSSYFLICTYLKGSMHKTI